MGQTCKDRYNGKCTKADEMAVCVRQIQRQSVQGPFGKLQMKKNILNN